MTKVNISAKNELPISDPQPKDNSRKVWIPVFKCNQVNRELDEVNKWTGKTFSEKEVWINQASAALDAAYSVLEDQENVIMVFFRQKKQGDTDSTIGIAVTSLSEEKNIEVRLPKVEFPHTITIVGGQEKK